MSLGFHPVIAEDMEILFSYSEDWRGFSGKHVLIAGSTSFLAAYLIEFFAFINERWPEQPVVVHALARSKIKLEQRFSHLLECNWFRPVIQDVCSPMPEFESLDYIVHAASAGSPKQYLRDPIGTMRANVLGSLNLLELARCHRARLLFMSSGAVYGHGESDRPISEHDFGSLDPLDISACYGEGKRAAETLCADYHRQYGVVSIIARISHTYGPGIALDDGRSFADFVAAAVSGQHIVLNSDGSGTRPFCYVADAAAAFLTLLLRGRGGEVYNVGMDKEISIFELAKLIVKLSPVAGIEVKRPAVKPERQELFRAGGHFDLSKIAQLGWKPSTPPEVGFARTLRYFTT